VVDGYGDVPGVGYSRALRSFFWFGYACYGKDYHNSDHIRIGFTAMNEKYDASSRGSMHD